MNFQKLCKLALAPATASLAIMLAASSLHAQGYVSGSGSASTMWGTSSGGVGGQSLVESANVHGLLGYSAGQVISAQNGTLAATNVTIMSIGSQNIVQVTGDNNVVDSKQKATTNGNISTTSDIGLRN